MAKQYMLPLLHRLANLRTEVATGRTRRNYGVGRKLTGKELSRRKTEIARLERWTGRDGQLTRAGQHSHLGLRPPSKDFDYNQPLIREGPNDYISSKERQLIGT